MKDNDAPRRKRPAADANDRLRNLYQSGDETGRTRPDDGSTFAGLEKIKKRHDDDDRR